MYIYAVIWLKQRVYAKACELVSYEMSRGDSVAWPGFVDEAQASVYRVGSNELCETEIQAARQKYYTDESKRKQATKRKSRLGKAASGRSSYDLDSNEGEEGDRDKGRLSIHEGGRHRSLIGLRPCDLRKVRKGRRWQ